MNLQFQFLFFKDLTFPSEYTGIRTAFLEHRHYLSFLKAASVHQPWLVKNACLH